VVFKNYNKFKLISSGFSLASHQITRRSYCSDYEQNKAGCVPKWIFFE